MGDISELRGLLVTVTFIGVLVFLVALIPPEFTVAEYEGRNVTTPNYFDISDIQRFNETWNYRMNETGGEYRKFWTENGLKEWYMVEVENGGEWFGGHNIDYYYTKANDTGNPFHPQIFFRHWYAENLFLVKYDNPTWTNGEGINRETSLEGTELNEDYTNGVAEYRVECKHFYMFCFFGFNTTLYDTPTEAWDNHALYVTLGINFDQMAMGFNAWNLISALVWFQLPDVHWIINVLLKIPFWVCISYLGFIFILRAIGAIFGGGA